MNTLIRSPPQPPSLSTHDAYTTWPGGVDPTADLFNTDNQRGVVGGYLKRALRRHRDSRKNRNSRKNRSSRKNRNSRRKH